MPNFVFLSAVHLLLNLSKTMVDELVPGAAKFAESALARRELHAKCEKYGGDILEMRRRLVAIEEQVGGLIDKVAGGESDKDEIISEYTRCVKTHANLDARLKKASEDHDSADKKQTASRSALLTLFKKNANQYAQKVTSKIVAKPKRVKATPLEKMRKQTSKHLASLKVVAKKKAESMVKQCWVDEAKWKAALQAEARAVAAKKLNEEERRKEGLRLIEKLRKERAKYTSTRVKIDVNKERDWLRTLITTEDLENIFDE